MAKILLVDDDAELLAMAALFLRRAEHVVTTAGNGKEAMRLVEGNVFDLVITDLVMPEKEGIEIIIELHRKLPALKILAISGGFSTDCSSFCSCPCCHRLTGASETGARGISSPSRVKPLRSET